MSGKRAVIVISLVEESAEISNRQIEKEIAKELSEHPPTIPWLKNVEKVTVTEGSRHETVTSQLYTSIPPLSPSNLSTN